MSELPGQYVCYSNRAVDTAVILSVTVVAANLGGKLLQEYVRSSNLPAQHEPRKRICNRFRHENIEIPFPHRAVYLREEKSWER
jgi:small-conductance mechanosensitive channel